MEKLHEVLCSIIQPSLAALPTILLPSHSLWRDGGTGEERTWDHMTGRQQAKLTEASCSGLRVSPVVHLLEAIKNWKAAEFGRAERKPRGRV